MWAITLLFSHLYSTFQNVTVGVETFLVFFILYVVINAYFMNQLNLDSKKKIFEPYDIALCANS